MSFVTTSSFIKEKPWHYWMMYTFVSALLYGWATHWPYLQPYVIRASFIDHMIPYVPESTPIYLSYFLLIPVFILLNRGHASFAKSMMIISIFTLIHLSFCILCPTVIEYREAENHLNSLWSRLLIAVDRPYAAFPSGHVGLPFCLYTLVKSFKARGSLLFLLWSLLMAFVILTTKQHFVPDLIGGLILGYAVAKISVLVSNGISRRGSIAMISVLAIFIEWLICILCILIGIQFWQAPVILASMLVIGTRQHALFMLYHDAVHGLVAKKKWLNDFIINLTVGVPFLIPVQFYRPLHLGHHQFLGQDADPEKKFLFVGQPWNYRALPLNKFIWQIFLDISTLSLWMSLLAVYRARHDRDCAFKKYSFDAWGSVYAALIIWGGLLLVAFLHLPMLKILVLFYIPYFSITPCLEKLRSFLEHNDHGDLTNSWAPGFIGRLTIWPYHINYHQEHHRKPSIPWYRLPIECSEQNLKPSSLALSKLLIVEHNSIKGIIFQRRT